MQQAFFRADEYEGLRDGQRFDVLLDSRDAKPMSQAARHKYPIVGGHRHLIQSSNTTQRTTLV